MAIDLNRKSAQEVIDAAQELVAGTPSDTRQINKYRIKAILNGGADGIRDFCLSRGLGDVYKRQS